MWNIGIGWIELALLLSMILATTVSRRVIRRWLGVGVAIVAIGVVSTPADPLSTLLVALPLAVAFIIGVYTAPRLVVR